METANIPAEIALGGIYFPPVMFAVALGTLLAMLLAGVLNRLNLTRFVWHPPLFFLALAVMCTRLVGLFLIPM